MALGFIVVLVVLLDPVVVLLVLPWPRLVLVMILGSIVVLE